MSQASTSLRSCCLWLSGASDAAIDERAKLARPGVVEAVDVAGNAVLIGKSRAEEQRVVGRQRDLDAGVDQPPQRHVLEFVEDAQRYVRRGTHLECDTARPRCDRRAPGLRRCARRALPELRCSTSRQPRTLSAPEQLTAVRDAGQPAVAGDPKGVGEVLGATPPFIVGQTETDDALDRRSGRRAARACERRAGGGCG